MYFYFKVILPSVTAYGIFIWGSCGITKFFHLESLHVTDAKIIFNLDWSTPTEQRSHSQDKVQITGNHVHRQTAVVRSQRALWLFADTVIMTMYNEFVTI